VTKNKEKRREERKERSGRQEVETDQKSTIKRKTV